MARQESKIKMGYYPLAPSAVDLIAQQLVPSARLPWAILDPCAGEGAALEQLADILGCQPDQRYAIELDKGRGEKVKERMPAGNVLSPCTALGGCFVPVKSFPIIYCNPPYDDERGDGSRCEGDFLEQVTNWLAPNGILVFVCPEKVAKLSYIKQIIGSWYDHVSIFPIPEDVRHYGEVVMIAVKRKEVTQWYHRQQYEIYDALGKYQIPAIAGPSGFYKNAMTDEELGLTLASSPLLEHLEPPPEPPLPSPPLQLGIGHLALLLASGHLNGLVSPAGEPPHVVRGTASKEKYVSDHSAEKNQDGSVTTKTIYSERIVLTVRTIDQNGDIKTFDSSPPDPPPEEGEADTFIDDHVVVGHVGDSDPGRDKGSEIGKSLPDDLGQFIGSTTFYKHPSGLLHFTDGVQYLAERCGAYWLIDVVASYQREKKLRSDWFQLWKIESNGNGGCVVTARHDSEKPDIVRQEIPYTDFPVDQPFEWYANDNEEGGVTMMLKSEY